MREWENGEMGNEGMENGEWRNGGELLRVCTYPKAKPFTCGTLFVQVTLRNPKLYTQYVSTNDLVRETIQLQAGTQKSCFFMHDKYYI